ncbi:Uncharacterized protein ChrSV_0739 [Chromobacterium vaccinii]|nr:Uncharacterized protein ChrSW_0739 [Chromobacterium vaccinii]QND88198.1 Uncharacterized protein ChrSV_0739 [Chromobacterium vaccinii]
MQPPFWLTDVSALSHFFPLKSVAEYVRRNPYWSDTVHTFKNHISSFKPIVCRQYPNPCFLGFSILFVVRQSHTTSPPNSI